MLVKKGGKKGKKKRRTMLLKNPKENCYSEKKNKNTVKLLDFLEIVKLKEIVLMVKLDYA